MPAWRNGRRDGLKIHCSQGCVGSSPTAGSCMKNQTDIFKESALERQQNPIACRPGCGACCIALSISSLIPPRNKGERAEPKPAGVPCRWLDDAYRCLLFGKPERPEVCISLRPEPSMCGNCREDALQYLAMLERLTLPETVSST